MQKSDASASRMKRLVGSTCAKMGVVVNARFKLSNASVASELHINDLIFMCELSKWKHNLGIILNKFSIKICKPEKTLHITH